MGSFDNVEEIQNEFRLDEEAAKELLIRPPSEKCARNWVAEPIRFFFDQHGSTT